MIRWASMDEGITPNEREGLVQSVRTTPGPQSPAATNNIFEPMHHVCNGPALTCISRDRGSMRAVRTEECDDSDASSITDFSMESEDMDHHSSKSPGSARFSLWMKQQEMSLRRDEGCEMLAALKRHRRGSEPASRLDGLRTRPSLRRSQTQSSFRRSQTSSTSNSSRSYSSFQRPEKKVIPRTIEILSKDNDTFNIYSSNVDFVEQSVSISKNEDAPVKIAPAAHADCSTTSPRMRMHTTSCMRPVEIAPPADRSPKVKFPSHPPTRPRPLRRRTVETPRLVPCQFEESLISLVSNPNDDGVPQIIPV